MSVICSRARAEHIPVIGTMVTGCISAMEARDIFQWDSLYPTVDDFTSDYEDGVLYTVHSDGEIAGCLCINEYQCPEYAEGDWKGTSFMVVHRLLVAPQFQGMGIGRQAMLFAEKMTRNNGKASIRLDAFTLNPMAVRLYQRLGYLQRGCVRFRKGMFHLFEKQV